ncbi:MAG: isoprenylcysteine carboxylmethyltransferase family protein, partial [Actinomycetota bacterium]
VLAFVAHRGLHTRRLDRSAPNDSGAADQPEPGEAIESMEPTALSRAASAMTLAARLLTAAYIAGVDVLDRAALPLPEAVRASGLGVAIAGFGLLEWAHRSLAENWRDRPQLLDTHRLITTRPYARIRHPIYLAFLAILGSTLLLSANWLVGGAWLAGVGLETVARVRYEESILGEHFGSAYHRYRMRTGVLVPRLRPR